LSEVAASRDGSGAEPLPRLDAELAAGTNQILLARDLVLVRKRTRHYLKVREAEVEQVFATREPRIQLEVLTSLPGGELRSPTTVHSYASAVPIAWLDTVLDYPPAQLRHYDGRVAVALNSLLLGESTVLPESFRYHFARELQHPRAVDVDTDFCRVPAAAIPKTTLQGAYYDLECHFPGHFGHVMTEVVSKLWGWDAAKARIPGLKALISAADDRSLALERRILTAYGIAPEDVVEVREPVWLEHLLGVTALWHNQVPHCVHPQLTTVWDRLRGGMALEGGPAHRRIFVSRGKAAANRECRNAKEVEGLFARFGFEVVYPELHDLSEQAAMFRDAEVIAGFGGAAMFNALYCSSLQTLIVLNHEAYTARNEHLISLLRPCEAHYFWSTPDFPHPPGYWYGSAFQSAWEFDFDRNEAELTSLLASLR
jgi:capsular polysaccharide biosynthesis protein